MSLRARFYLALLTGCVVIGLHILANNLYLYWTYRQIDIPIHILGGVMSGLFILTGLRYMSWSESLKYVVTGCLIIGIGWELLEFFYKVQDITPYYYLDTVKDLLDDCIGGVISLKIWKKLPEVKV
jgi:hypothetical protein